MTQPAAFLAPSIGACLPCRQLFLVTPDTPNCILCGRPPAYSLPFPAAQPELTEGPVLDSDAPAGLITREEAIGHLMDLGWSKEGAEEKLGPEPPAPEGPPCEDVGPEHEEEEAPETIKDSEFLPVVIAAFLVGDVAVDEEQLKGVFEDVGAEPEAAATAVGRLSAVRELLEQLQLTREPAPVAPAPPEAESSPSNT